MTAYRQRALACAAALVQAPARPRDLKPTMPDAQKILHSNVYGWFVRIERGIYTLSETGKAALVRWKAHLPDHGDGPQSSDTAQMGHSQQMRRTPKFIDVRFAPKPTVSR
jgi:hypothetical protein